MESVFDYESNTKSRRLTDFLASRPKAAVSGIFLLAMIMLAVWVSGAFNQQFAEDGGSYLAVDDIVIKRHILQFAHEDREIDPATVRPLSTSHEAYQMMILYSPTSDAKNIFTPTMLTSIWRNERAAMGLGTRCDDCETTIRDFTRFCHVNTEKLDAEGRSSEDTCAITSVRDCEPPISPLSLFFQGMNYFDINATHLDALTQEQIDATLSSISSDAANTDIGFFFDDNFRASDDDGGANPVSRHTRSVLKFGAPVCATRSDGSQLYRNRFDNFLDQDDIHEDFVKQYTKFFEEGEPSGIETQYLEEILANHEILVYITEDLLLALGAGVFITICISVQTSSLFLGAFGMLTILLAYPITLFVYHGIYQIEFDTNLNRLAIFIILGVGADDIFVFADAWKQSLHEGRKVTSSIARRLNWTWKRASGAMLITSFTTFVALILTANSPMPMVRAFGVFTGTMVLFNFVMVITFFPAIVVINENHFAHRRYPWQKAKSEKGTEKVVVCMTPSQRSMDDDVCTGESGSMSDMESVSVPDSSTSDEDISSDSHDGSAKKEDIVDIDSYRFIERYFYGKHTHYILRYRYAILAVFLAILVAGIVGTSRLEAPLVERPEGHLPTKSSVVKFYARLEDFPASSADGSQAEPDIFVYYGVTHDEPLDRDGIDPNDEENWGTVNIDSAFASNFDRAAQDHMRFEVCDRIIGETFENNDVFVRRQAHDCVIRDFLEWTDVAYPGIDDNVSSRMYEFVSQNRTDLAKWIAFDFPNGEAELRYIVLRFSSNFLYQDGRDIAEYWLRGWNDLIDDVNSKAPSGLQNSFHGSEQWAFLTTSDIMGRATRISIAISYVVAVVCLLLALQNWIIALLASFTIGAIVFTTIGFYTFAGETLDTIHSIIYVMLVGLSVDFVAHLANAYNTSRSSSRSDRSREALLEVGVSVLGGAVTTISAGIVLLFGQLRFFLKFGETLFGTILVGVVWSLFGFMAILVIFGPNKHPQGDLRQYFDRYFERRSKTSKLGADSKESSDDSSTENGPFSVEVVKKPSQKSKRTSSERVHHEIELQQNQNNHRRSKSNPMYTSVADFDDDEHKEEFASKLHIETVSLESSANDKTPKHLSIIDSLRGKNIFITGATGLVGKALVEKILRSIPEVGKLYTLVRPSKGASAGERFEEKVLKSEVFNRLRAEREDCDDFIKSKLVPIFGDVTKEHAGISDEDQAILAKSVQIVIHVAGSTSFMEPVKRAIEINTKGSTRIMELAKSWSKVEAFVHTSTTYVNTYKIGMTEENAYPLPFDYNEVVKHIEAADNDDDPTPLLHGFPDSYVLSKSITEHALIDKRGSLPLAIVRPAVVGCAAVEPMRGWVDSMSGVGAVVKYIGKGIVRLFPGKSSNPLETVPLDYVVNAMIASVPDILAKGGVEVYNISSSSTSLTTCGDVSHSAEFFAKHPIPKCIGTPVFKFNDETFDADFKRIYSSEPFSNPRVVQCAKVVVSQYRRIAVNGYTFASSKIHRVSSALPANERKTFNLDLTSIDWRNYYHKYAYGFSRYCLKQDIPEDTIDAFKLSNQDSSVLKLRNMTVLEIESGEL